MYQTYPAPWHLKGNGYIMLYRFNKAFTDEYGLIPPELFGRFRGGFGSVMIVDYLTSTAGPYRELLFIPGIFDYNGKKHYCITKIYVSTGESVENGRENWGIPKEFADFQIEKKGAKTERLTVSTTKGMIFAATFTSHFFSIPLSTRLYSVPLVQPYNGKTFLTHFAGRGRGKLASVKSLQVNEHLFPDISRFRPWSITRIENFNITFPVAEIRPTMAPV